MASNLELLMTCWTLAVELKDALGRVADYMCDCAITPDHPDAPLEKAIREQQAAIKPVEIATIIRQYSENGWLTEVPLIEEDEALVRPDAVEFWRRTFEEEMPSDPA